MEKTTTHYNTVYHYEGTAYNSINKSMAHERSCAFCHLLLDTHPYTHTHPATIPHTHSTALFNQTHTSLDPYNALKPN